MVDAFRMDRGLRNRFSRAALRTSSSLHLHSWTLTLGGTLCPGLAHRGIAVSQVPSLSGMRCGLRFGFNPLLKPFQRDANGASDTNSRPFPAPTEFVSRRASDVDELGSILHR